MVVHLFFALTVSIRWGLLFPTLCWSINTKSMATTCFLFPFSSITRHLHAHSFYVILHTIHPSFLRPTSTWVSLYSSIWAILLWDQLKSRKKFAFFIHLYLKDNELLHTKVFHKQRTFSWFRNRFNVSQLKYEIET
jgi:hypothetical protein